MKNSVFSVFGVALGAVTVGVALGAVTVGVALGAVTVGVALGGVQCIAPQSHAQPLPTLNGNSRNSRNSIGDVVVAEALLLCQLVVDS